MLHGLRRCLLIVLALALAMPLMADDICSPEERRANDAAEAKALAAEKSGDLQTALKSGQQAMYCGGSQQLTAMLRRVRKKLGEQAETDGKLSVAFTYFVEGEFFGDAKRVGLKQLAAKPGNFGLATDLMAFMHNQGFTDEVRQIQDQARQQANKLLAEEEQAFSVRTPQREKLSDARKWLELAGDPVAPVQQRALKRADGYFALDYHYALEQAIAYYELADYTDKARPQAVRTKARRLADQLAGGDNWAAAVELYQLAGDNQRAEELAAKRRADAAKDEETRKEEFQKEQDDLEKELDL